MKTRYISPTRQRENDNSNGWQANWRQQGADLVQIQNRRGPITLDMPAPDATEENIKGTSVDRENPVWPRWIEPLPRPGEKGDFISNEPFYVIDEIEGTVKLYPPGTPLEDTNLDGRPGKRLRGTDSVPGNPWRQRIQPWRGS